jgi:hypothetical protein
MYLVLSIPSKSFHEFLEQYIWRRQLVRGEKDDEEEIR